MTFGKTKVINNLTFTVKRGETFGFLGSNGSGKTTTIRALLGINPPTSGELLIDGKPYSVSGGIKLGYLPEERGLSLRIRQMFVSINFLAVNNKKSSSALPL